MITSNYEDDIVFARFLIYIKKALSDRRCDYIKSEKLKRKFETIFDNERMDIISDNTNSYTIYDELDIFKLSYNLNYINKLNLALETLSQKQQMVINCYYYKNMSNKEIAEKMNITECAIEKLKTRALKKLKKHFTEEIKNEME